MSDFSVTDPSEKQRLAKLKEEEHGRERIILAVDDSPDILKSVFFVLRDEYKVITLPKPQNLATLLKQVTPDLFLLDYNMPVMTGFDLVPTIRNLKRHKDTPIIFLTSEGTIDNLSAAIALGASDFIVKPFEPDILRERIAKHIYKR